MLHIDHMKAASVLATTLAVTSCAALTEKRLPTADEVRGATVTACSFAPTVSTVSSLLAAGVPGLTTAQAIAAAICKAVQDRASAGPSATPPSINGVVIEGRRV